MKTIPTILTMLLAAMVLTVEAGAQLKSEPIRVVLTSKDRSTEVRVENTTSSPMQITTSVQFGVYISDSTGLRYIDTNLSDQYQSLSCDRWTRVFPEKFILRPKERRTIRVISIPPADIPDGEYTARLKLATQKLEKPRTIINPDEDTVEVRTDTRLDATIGQPIMFRKGPLQTSIEIASARAKADTTGATQIVAFMKKGGNAAYRGILGARVYTPEGMPIDSANVGFIAELDVFQNVTLGKLEPGTYRLDLSSTLFTRGTVTEVVIGAPPSYQSYDMIVTGSEIQLLPRSDDPIYMPQPRMASE